MRDPDVEPKRLIMVTADLYADPGYQRIDLDAEWSEIDNEIRQSKLRDLLDVKPVFAATHEGLIKAIVDTKPHILHFSGHGEPGELVLRDKKGKGKALKLRHLAEIIEDLASQTIEMIVLNGCYSAVDTGALEVNVDFLIGMSDEITDLSARRFAAGFYYALGSGMSVVQAFNAGRHILKSDGSGEQKIPVLRTRAGASKTAPFLAEPPDDDGAFLEQLRLTPPAGMRPSDGYRYRVMEVCHGYERPLIYKVMNHECPFREDGPDIVADLHQTKLGLQYKCCVEVAGTPPDRDAIETMMNEAGWSDPQSESGNANRFWFLVPGETAEPSAEGFINNYLRWSLPSGKPVKG